MFSCCAATGAWTVSTHIPFWLESTHIVPTLIHTNKIYGCSAPTDRLALFVHFYWCSQAAARAASAAPSIGRLATNGARTGASPHDARASRAPCGAERRADADADASTWPAQVAVAVRRALLIRLLCVLLFGLVVIQ